MKFNIKNTTQNIIFSGLMLFGLAAFDARAGLQVQTDTNALAPLSTNTFLLYGDRSGWFTNGEQCSGNQFIDGSKADDVWLSYGGFFTNTTSGASNVTFTAAQSVNDRDWLTNGNAGITPATPLRFVLVVPASTTNWVVGHTNIQNCAPGYGLRTIENSNSVIMANPGSCFFSAFVKNGI